MTRNLLMLFAVVVLGLTLYAWVMGHALEAAR